MAVFLAVSLYPIVFIKMKIGILTLPPRENYGGILQCYALQTILERMGHKVTIIDEPYKAENIPLYQMSLRICKRLFYKYILRRKCNIFIERDLEKSRPIILQHLERFIKQYLHRKIYASIFEIEKNEFDAIIVGSDQIWRYKYCKHIDNAFLVFTGGWNVKRIYYAASFGTDYWDYSKRDTKKCRKAITLFNAVSVREDSGVQLCKKYLNIDAEWVVDPTMLLQKKDYEQLIDSYKTTQCKGNLFCYILDKSFDKEQLIKKVAEEKKLIPFSITDPNGNIRTNINGLIKQPIEYWLKAFRDSEFIITDSFHACVFCIIFNKPFVVIGNFDRGMTRFESLFKRFKIQNNLLFSSRDYEVGKDYSLPTNIDIILKESVQQGLNFLNNNL